MINMFIFIKILQTEVSAYLSLIYENHDFHLKREDTCAYLFLSLNTLFFMRNRKTERVEADTALHSTNPEHRLCVRSNSVRGVS